MLRESRMNTQEQNVQLIVHGTTDRVGIDARRRDGGGSSCPFVADGVCPARADGRGLSARSRALTPLCELGVSGSGVGESRSVGRVSSRAGPRGRWGGCQKTILSKLAGRQTFSIWVYGQAKGHVCGTETSYLLRSTHNTSTFIYVPIPCSMGMESRRTQPGRARAGLDRAPTPYRAPYTRPRAISPSEPSRGLQYGRRASCWVSMTWRERIRSQDGYRRVPNLSPRT